MKKREKNTKAHKHNVGDGAGIKGKKNNRHRGMAGGGADLNPSMKMHAHSVVGGTRRGIGERGG